tara:strand:- start:65 stop:727 length:663 start_codon:yes stop_codon:yes gene_type:complete
MQLINPPSEKLIPIIELAMQLERLDRYMPAANKNRELAFRYYLWNCKLCESFHFPLHFSEIVCRNALHNALIKRAGAEWYTNVVFRNILDAQFQQELASAEFKERAQHGDKVTSHHIVSALTFGFWEHLTTKRFERFLWAKGIQNIFPCAPKEMTLLEIHDLIESVRRWRNRIAHHRAIFDKGPIRKYTDALMLIKIACADTSTWVSSSSEVQVALTLRP